jgi:RNA polymerase sigma-70 factor (ECF subfamily)
MSGRSSIRGDGDEVPVARNQPDIDALYRRYREPLHALCIARLGDRALAEDVVQEVFAKALSVLPRFDPSRPFWPWLASIAARECVDAHRRRVAGARHEQLASGPATTPDVTARAALSRLAQRAVAAEIDRLPPRQRAAVQLFAVDGWSHAEVAERLGCSPGTVRLLVMRARIRLRRAQSEVLAGVAAGCRRLAHRLQAMGERAALLLPWRPLGGGMWMHGVGRLAGAAVVAAGVVGFPHPAAGEGSETFSRLREPVSDAHRWRAEAPSVTRPSTQELRPWASPEPTVQAVGRTLQRSANEAGAPVLRPAGPGTDDEQVQGFTVSPAYGTDRTIFVTEGPRLSVSRDGGASWSRLRALGPSIGRILLPPAYPHDPRIYSLGLDGLALSDNGGDTFELVAAGLFRDAALSPGFDAGDPTVLLLGNGLWRHDSRVGSTEPILLDEGMTGHTPIGVMYDSTDPRHRSVHLLSGVPLSTAEGSRSRPSVQASTNTSHISRCTLPAPASDQGIAGIRPPARLTCTSKELDGFVASPAGLVPLAGAGSGRALSIVGQHQLLVSTDAGETFRPTALWEDRWLHIGDIAALPSATVSFVVARAAEVGEPALLRTDDAGESWAPISVDLPGFERLGGGLGGANRVVVTPTGRILAGGMHGGIACSVDGGRTWAPTCPAPDR